MFVVLLGPCDDITDDEMCGLTGVGVSYGTYRPICIVVHCRSGTVVWQVRRCMPRVVAVTLTRILSYVVLQTIVSSCVPNVVM